MGAHAGGLARDDGVAVQQRARGGFGRGFNGEYGRHGVFYPGDGASATSAGCHQHVEWARLAERHLDKFFVWIDIEDHADIVGDLDVENFPTLLVQRHELVAFFGTMLPDANIAHRLLQTKAAYSDAELATLADSSEERREWQRDCNLRTLMRAA